MLIEEMQFKVYGKDILKQEDFKINDKFLLAVMYCLIGKQTNQEFLFEFFKA